MLTDGNGNHARTLSDQIIAAIEANREQIDALDYGFFAVIAHQKCAKRLILHADKSLTSGAVIPSVANLIGFDLLGVDLT